MLKNTSSRSILENFVFAFSYYLYSQTFFAAFPPVRACSVTSQHLHVCTGWSSRFRFHRVIRLPAAERFDVLHLLTAGFLLIARPEMIRRKAESSCLPCFNGVSLTTSSRVKWAVTDGILFDSVPAGSSVQQFSFSPIRTLRFNSDKVIFPVVFYLIITSLEKPQKTHSFIDNMFNWAN